MAATPACAARSCPVNARFLVLLALPAVAACGGEAAESADPVEADALANRIAAVAELREEKVEPPPRLGPLADADIPAEDRAGAACRFEQGDRLLLLASSSGAIARVDGRVARLRTAGPVGPSGGFFEAPGVTVSIGRRAPPEAAADASPALHAGATVGGASNRPIEKLAGRWLCSAQSVIP